MIPAEFLRLDELFAFLPVSHSERDSEALESIPGRLKNKLMMEFHIRHRVSDRPFQCLSSIYESALVVFLGDMLGRRGVGVPSRITKTASFPVCARERVSIGRKSARQTST